ncbi:MAG: OmpH family outer membrane protein, partial [Bacteroidales bacterium]|nr:OmpH family outer membrane protein [Bacteroidales bacterium]
MKKILLFAFTAFFTVAASAQTSQSGQSIKFGHVDFNQLIQLMPEMDSARVKLAAASKETQDTYDSMLAEFQTKAQEYQNKNATWTPAVKQIKETQ